MPIPPAVNTCLHDISTFFPSDDPSLARREYAWNDLWGSVERAPDEGSIPYLPRAFRLQCPAVGTAGSCRVAAWSPS
jgi:hypothetical protein